MLVLMPRKMLLKLEREGLMDVMYPETSLHLFQLELVVLQVVHGESLTEFVRVPLLVAAEGRGSCCSGGTTR
jgi:hypothetical protein